MKSNRTFAKTNEPVTRKDAFDRANDRHAENKRRDFEQRQALIKRFKEKKP
jgi:hypothetical protein